MTTRILGMQLNIIYIETPKRATRNFQKFGWAGVTFGTGLAIISKLQAYDDTESALATQV